MTEESVQTPNKLPIDREDDFKFHCAYLAYSKAWDENTAPEARKKLNELIESLQGQKISYDLFYRQLDEFRDIHGYMRQGIQTARKREWRYKEQKRNRISRHRR